MARYTGPVCRLCRRERTKLYLKGERCFTMKCPVAENSDRQTRAFPPGMHGRDRQRQGSEYLTQLREKQFRNLYEEASRRPGMTGTNLLQFLELRLDNIAYRAGWGASRAQARQFVRHGHVTIDGKRVTIPSYRVRPGEVIALKNVTRENFNVKRNLDVLDRTVPGWLETGENGFNVTVRIVPQREQIDESIKEQLIVELYSK
jgi:small subunit ribosomal protein S4